MDSVVRKKWKLFAVAAVFAVLLGVRLAWTVSEQTSELQAENGVMDLRNWDPASGRIVPLQGDWSFYPGVFIAPGGKFENRDQTVVRVPGGWDRRMDSAFGYGTYKLELLMPTPPAGEAVKYAIRTSIIRNSHTLFVNGQRVGGSGIPGESRETTKPFVMPYVADFTVNGDRAQLVVHAANFEYARMGGILQPISIGTKKTVERWNMLKIGQNSILMGSMLVSGLLFLMLFFFRKRNREFLYFSLFFWALLLFWLTHNERMLFLLFPDMPYGLQAKLQTLPFVTLFVCFLGFVQWMYPKHAHPWAMRIAVTGMSVFSAIVLFTKVAVFSGLEMLIMGFNLIQLGYCCYILVKEVAGETRDSVTSLIALCCVAFGGIFQMLYYLGFDALSGYPPVEQIVFLLTMALVIAKRFFNGMREVETLSKRLIVADRLKNDFLATTSNELKLPLHGMINIAQVMMDEEIAGDRQRERLSLLMATGRRLSHLLNDILDLSKLNEGGLELKRGPVDVRMLISGVTDVMHYLKDGRSVRFDNRAPAGLIQVLADEHRLMQILFHLFHYAIKWGAQGNVAITAQETGQPGKVEIRIHALRGMDRQAEGEENPENADDFSLEISRKLLGLHDSQLTVEKSGLALTIVFGLTAVDETGAPLSSTAGPLSVIPGLEAGLEKGISRHYVPNAPRVLIVDDDPVSLRVMFDVLVQERLDVTALTDGYEALRMIEQEGGWDLIVLDAMLPEISGYDLCREIRKRHSFYDLPVLFLTVRSQPAYLLVGFDAGANDYVTKPVETSEFRARTRTLLQMKQSIRERLDIEMALIQAQIKPHFLYNTLNTIASLSEIDPDRTRDLLAEFGSYLQSCFDMRNLDRKVPFEREWTLVQSYLNIEKARFGSRIQITSSLPEHSAFTIPPLTIQPIVENALRHGILKRIEGGSIHISVKESYGWVRISVRDNGEGFPPSKKDAVLSGTYRSGIGLVNVHRRLKNAYGHGLSIDSVEGEWTEVSFRIPVTQAKEDIA